MTIDRCATCSQPPRNCDAAAGAERILLGFIDISHARRFHRQTRVTHTHTHIHVHLSISTMMVSYAIKTTIVSIKFFMLRFFFFFLIGPSQRPPLPPLRDRVIERTYKS